MSAIDTCITSIESTLEQDPNLQTRNLQEKLLCLNRSQACYLEYRANDPNYDYYPFLPVIKKAKTIYLDRKAKGGDIALDLAELEPEDIKILTSLIDEHLRESKIDKAIRVFVLMTKEQREALAATLDKESGRSYKSLARKIRAINI